MNVKFGTCTADPAVIHKENYITLGSDVNCQVKENSTIINPTLIVKYSTIDPAKDNYAFIDKWGRYYYITNIRFITGDRAEVDLAVDVLHTYRADSDSMNVYVSRVGDESLRAAYINDPAFPMTGETYIHNYEFQFGMGGNPFMGTSDINTKNYILTVIGGRNST